MILRGGILVLLLLTIASAVSVVTAKHRHRHLFHEMTRLEKDCDELEIEFKQYQLEQATYAESTLIERIARERLGMLLPKAEEIVLVRP